MVRKQTDRQWWKKNLYRESAEVAPDTYYTLQIAGKDKAEREFDQVQLEAEERKKECVFPPCCNLKVLQGMCACCPVDNWISFFILSNCYFMVVLCSDDEGCIFIVFRFCHSYKYGWKICTVS